MRIARRLRFAALAGAAAALFASAGCTPAQSVFEAYCAKYAEVICNVQVDCECTQSEVLDECLFAQTEGCIDNVIYALETGNIAFDDAVADTCLDDMQSALGACDYEAEYPESCAGVFYGILDQGETCYDSDQCAEGLACNWDLNQCQPLAASGQSCEFVDCVEGVYCDWDTYLCVTPHPNGEDCTDGVPCAEGFYCDDYGTGTCVPPHAATEDCADYIPCVDGYYCDDTDYTCVPQKADGEPCLYSDECLSGDCDWDAEICISPEFCDLF